MLAMPHSVLKFRPSLPFVLLCVFLATLWLAGGASRADALGQSVVRAVSWGVLAIACLFGPRPTIGRAWPILAVLLVAVTLCVLQLVPLPPALWQALPNHERFAEAAMASGQPQPWRPISIAPGATMNSAASLVVPLTAFLLMLTIDPSERRRVPALLLGFIVASLAVATLQFSSGTFDNIFVNDSRSVVSGTFANRNHFALLLAIGCLLALPWATMEKRQRFGRAIGSIGLILLMMLMILASGSRAGLGLGIVAVLIAMPLSARKLYQVIKRRGGLAAPAVLAGIAGAVAMLVIATVLAGRAESISRAIATDQGQELRVQTFPVVVQLTKAYFPIGTGLGSFDQAFRMYEPDQLLKPTYFNNAHNDVLETALTAGLPGLLLLALSVSWAAWAAYRAWRRRGDQADELAKVGSGVLLLVLLASFVDYPARTPTIMAIMVIAAIWLAGQGAAPSPALPRGDPEL